MANTSFSSGFGAGLGLGALRDTRDRTSLMQQQNALEQKKLLQTNLKTGYDSTLKQLIDQSKQFAASVESASDETKRANTLNTYDQFVETIIESEEQKLNVAQQMGLISPDDVSSMKARLRLASTLTDPVAQEKLEQDVKTEGAIETAEGKQPLQLEQIRVRAEEARKTAAVRRTQVNIQEDPDELAPPQIGQIYGIENATMSDLANANIFVPKDNKTLRELIPANTAYKGLVTSGTTALDVLRKNPDVAPIGGLSEFWEGVESQATALARLANINVSEVNLESEVIQNEVEKLAGANRELQATMKSMAYASAIAKGQTGQGLSDKDVANEIQQIGGDAKTSEGMQRAIMAFMERTESEYRARISNTLSKEPPKSAYSMNSDELVQFIEQAGGFENLPSADQQIVRVRAKFLKQRMQ